MPRTLGSGHETLCYSAQYSNAPKSGNVLRTKLRLHIESFCGSDTHGTRDESGQEFHYPAFGQVFLEAGQRGQPSRESKEIYQDSHRHRSTLKMDVSVVLSNEAPTRLRHEASSPPPRSRSINCRAARIGPIECELDGPIPIVNRSKTLMDISRMQRASIVVGPPIPLYDFQLL